MDQDPTGNLMELDIMARPTLKNHLAFLQVLRQKYKMMTPFHAHPAHIRRVHHNQDEEKRPWRASLVRLSDRVCFT